MSGKKVAIGLSGGVDSSVSASMLVEQGYEVTGVYLECWRAPGCRTEEDRQDALKIALQLNIPFQVLDFKEAYRQRVVEYFFAEYEAGRTPNPDVMCNKEIKFGLFYDWAMEQGFDFVATGHYAQVKNGKQLITSTDAKKDQTYFLYRLQQNQLAHILFPIGHLTKDQVRKEATARNLPVANKPDSQGICFIGEINVHNFLRERLGENPGEVINSKGEVMGTHKGLWFYTVGQRHGFEINGTWKSQHGETRHAMPPYYVIGKIPAKNQLIVGFGNETYVEEFELEDPHWLVDKTVVADAEKHMFVRIRHGGKLIPASFKLHRSKIIVELAEPTQGIAEGQSAVFYEQVSGVRSQVSGLEQLANRQPATDKFTRQTFSGSEPEKLDGQVNYQCLGGGVISKIDNSK